ncbi:hypothetical protein ACJX0J_040710, partial [Zea mays]
MCSADGTSTMWNTLMSDSIDLATYFHLQDGKCLDIFQRQFKTRQRMQMKKNTTEVPLLGNESSSANSILSINNLPTVPAFQSLAKNMLGYNVYMSWQLGIYMTRY